MTFGLDGSIAERLQSLPGKFHKKQRMPGKTMSPVADIANKVRVTIF